MKALSWTVRVLAVVLTVLFLLLGFAAIFSAQWYISTYGDTGFDSIIFSLFSNLGAVAQGLVKSYIFSAILPALACTAILSVALLVPLIKSELFLKAGQRKIRIYPIKRAVAAALSLVLSLSLIIAAACRTRLFEYIENSSTPSTLFENEYVDPLSVNIEFPENKRNLIYIFVESLETTFFSEDEGGALEYNVIPRLHRLACDNVNFSHSGQVGGYFANLDGLKWTAAAMVAHTAGIPIKLTEDIADHNSFGADSFLPGAASLMNILSDNGYYQVLMMGSGMDFGNRDVYYYSHGLDEIYDFYRARSEGFIPDSYHDGWWGMEDYRLFEYAKQKLSEISASSTPFALTLLTVDTHHIGGNTCPYCQNEYAERYENVYSCADRQLADFVNWLAEQPYYDDTAVIITGDHLSMDSGYMRRNVEDSYVRRVYNCFINSAVQPINEKNREFCALDMFPSTLAAMGCIIEGERLGLGVNLFSDIPTLMEKYGTPRFAAELAKGSEFYERFNKEE